MIHAAGMQAPDVAGLQVHECVGVGPCGRVYRASDADGRVVAVKVFNAVSVNRELLEEAAARLEEQGWPEGVMPEWAADFRRRPALCVGPFVADEGPEGAVPASLQHRLGAFPGQDSWPVVLGILDSLAGLHGRQVAHGNLKPGNVFFGAEGRVLLSDWALGNMPGIAHLEYTDAYLYQPPEQLRDPGGYLREKGYRWDVFAFGVLAYRLLTGRFPRCAETFAKVTPPPGETRLEGISADPGKIARALEAEAEVVWGDEAANVLEESYREIVVRCLALDPMARPADGMEVRRAFVEADGAAAAERRTEALLDQTRRSRRAAWRANVAALALACGVVLLAAVLQLTRSQHANERARKSDEISSLQAAVGKSAAAKNEAETAKAEAERTLEYERSVWLARIDTSRAIGDHLFAWAMEKGHRRLPPLDGRELRLSRLERYFQDFVTRTAEIESLKEERARARLQLAEISLAKGEPKAAEARLEDALAAAADLPAGPDLDLRIATDRLLLALLLQERGDKGTGEAFRTARKALEGVPQAEVDADRVQELIAVLDFHESRLLAAAGRDGEALAKLHGATQVLNGLADQHPDAVVLRSELVSCYLSSATILDGIGRMGDAREVRSLAAEELLKLIKENPADLDLRLELAGCYGAMAEAAMLSGDVSGTEAMSKGATKLLEDLLRQRPDSAEIRSRLAAQRGLMAGVLRDRGEADEAERLVEDGILLVEGVAVGERGDPVAKYRLALLWWQKARLMGADGKRSEEIALASKAVEALRRLADSSYGIERAEQIRRSLGYVLGDLGHAAQLAGDAELATKAFGDAVAAWEHLQRERPGNEEYEEGLEWSRQRLKELK